MSTRKILAWVVALLVIVFPFRRAFLSDQGPGIMTMASFIVTLMGIVVFYMLTMNPKTKEQQ